MAKTALTVTITSDNFLNGWGDNEYRVRTDKDGQEYINLLGTPFFLTKEKSQKVNIEGNIFNITRKNFLDK